MRNSAKRILTNAILEAQTWKPDRSRLALENDFYELMLRGPSLDEYPELWRDLRIALAENEFLENPDLQEFLSRTDYAREGYWWFDPAEWKNF
ncbi:MAG: hypothetical protein FH748_03430 [Balneolaceae bacterium]|nr:hypothetical protein [Balneolaceae bacterium]